MIVLLPPSEGKALGGRGRFDVGAGPLGERRLQVVESLAKELAAGPPVWPRLFGHGGDIGERAAAACQALVEGRAPALPAWRRFTGVVWAHLDPATLPPAARRNAVVPTAMLGATRGDEPVPDFRLKLSVSLTGLGRLDRWWRADLTDAIARTGRGPIVDLLPAEHAAAVDWVALAARRRVSRVRFVATDGRAAAGHAAKAVKGIVARRILLGGGLEALAGFEWQGWRAELEPGGATVRPIRALGDA
jgi:cytoplasmic iron level regulating protein YaaA (DUF328/UPF0246 family)